MSTKKIISITTGLAFVASAILAVPAFAQTSDANAQSNNGLHIGASLQGQARVGGYSGAGRGQGMMARLGVFGKVTAISGNTITISGRQGFGTTTAAISYAIDATNASVKKNNATSTISSIAVGDMVFAQGTVTGTNVVATTISDGALGRMGNRGQGNVGNKGMKNGGPEIASSSQVIGNGQPVVAGTISAINGNTVTITNASNMTYTADISSSKILRGQKTIAIANLVIGDKVVVQGTVNGTSIVASTIIDQATPSTTNPTPAKEQSRGFFGNIGYFFTHLFGF